MNESGKGQRVRLAGALGLAISVGALLLAVLLPGGAGASTAGPPPPRAATPCTVGTGPNRAAYDPVNHNMYIPNSYSASVTVLNGTCHLVGTVALPTGSFAAAAAFNPLNNRIYVTDSGLNQVYEIAGTTLKATITSSLLSDPYGMLFDPGDNVLAIANAGHSDVCFMSTTAVNYCENAGTDPFEISYDPFWGNLLVTNEGSNNVSIYNAVTLGHIVDVSVGTEPTGIAYDPVDHEDYVANFASANVTVLSDTLLAATISGFNEPDGVAWSQAALKVYITNAGSGKVFEVSGTTVVKKVTISTTALNEISVTYDDFNNKVYVSDFGSGTGKKVFVIS